MKALVKMFAVAMMLVAFVGFNTNAASLKGKERKNSHKKAVVLSAEEIALRVALDSFYDGLVEDAAHEIAHDLTAFDRVEVYNSNGKLVKAIDIKGQEFNELMIPAKAERVMVDNRVAYYMVIE